MFSDIRDDASEDNKTSELCMEELKNCEQQSAGEASLQGLQARP